MPGSPGSSPMLLSEIARFYGEIPMKFVDAIHKGENLITRFPFRTDPSPLATVNQIRNANLGTVNWSKFNEQAAPTRNSSRNVQGQVHGIADYIQADKRLIRAAKANPAKIDPVQQAFDTYTAAKTIEINYRLFRNNQVTGDEDAPPGWYEQFASTTTMDANFINSQMLMTNGTALDITPTSGTAASAMRVFEQIDELRFRMGAKDKKSVKIVLDAGTLRRLKTLAATSRLFEVNKNQWDQSITSYDGCEIVEMGFQSDGSTRIIPNTETVAGTTLTGDKHTSIWLMDSDPDKFYWWQTNVMNPEPLPDEGVFKQWLFEWAFGYIYASDRCIGRISGIKVQD